MDLSGCDLAFGPNTEDRCEWCGGGLPVLRARFCSSTCEHDAEVNHLWGRARIAALARDAWACAICGASDVEEKLEVHHDPPVEREGGYEPGCQHHQARLRTLCCPHHREAHRAIRSGSDTQLSIIAA